MRIVGLLFSSLCLIFLTTNTYDVKRIVYPTTIVSSAIAGAIVGSLADRPRGSLAVLAIVASPLFTTVPLGLALINMIITIRGQGRSIISSQGYNPTIYNINFDNLENNVAIVEISLYGTLFTYFTIFGIAALLKQKLIGLYEKFCL